MSTNGRARRGPNLALRTADPKEWPWSIDAPDLAGILNCSVRSAERRLASGAYGPVRRDGHRYVIRREVLLAGIKAAETDNRPAPERRGRRRR